MLPSVPHTQWLNRRALKAEQKEATFHRGLPAKTQASQHRLGPRKHGEGAPPFYKYTLLRCSEQAGKFWRRGGEGACPGRTPASGDLPSSLPA